MTINTFESAARLSEATDTKKGRYRIQLIEGNRLGSSGWWPRETLEADGPTVFAKGLHIMLDHLSETETWDRPEGSVRNLIGVLETDAVYEEASEANGESEGLYADVQFFPMYQEMIEALREHVGMSIRALAEADYREVGGNVIPYITKIHEGFSVDVVTHAGAGGRILEALESKKPNIPEHVKDKLLLKSAEESTKGEINMADLTEETASALVSSIGKLAGLFEAQANASTPEVQEESEGENMDSSALFDAFDKVQKSGLSESARSRVLGQLKESNGNVDVDKLIADEEAYAKALLAESGVPGKRVTDSTSSTTFKTMAEASRAWARPRSL